MSRMPASFPHHLDWYASIVRSVSVKPDESESAAADRIIYSYEIAFHGFAARLSEEEAALLEQQHGVVAVFPEVVYKLHTTRSPGFLGLQLEAFMGVWANAISSHDVIVGVLDTGIWPESLSFSDAGMGPVLAWWKGACEVGGDFASKHCNRTIVGARTFYRSYKASAGVIDEREKTPRDRDGHGTHTAATVAGSAVPNASLLGYAPGTARGMAPAVRVAAYKVCWPRGPGGASAPTYCQRWTGPWTTGWTCCPSPSVAGSHPTTRTAYLWRRLGPMGHGGGDVRGRALRGTTVAQLLLRNSSNSKYQFVFFSS
ncbi:hypothetical protein Taro_037029 [Colocasia esculenta]|uniref:Uncharacterized protein n=1 Tax=Colocasia esculenta TaxID=4460 RepID=A0A843WI11_COLES|nr:hypothetical protein [Colocasia esculenta]